MIKLSQIRPNFELSRVLPRLRNVARYVLRADFRGFCARLRTYKADRQIMTARVPVAGQGSLCIMATRHVLFVAHLFAERLRTHGWEAEILTRPPDTFIHDFYFVICPQMFSKLPPGGKRVAFQLEQSVTSRWLTARYLEILKSSFAVIDYSLRNIAFMEKKGIAYPQVHYLPVGASATYAPCGPLPAKNCDVLFYGDTISPRRRKMLDALARHFDLRVVNEVFGNEMVEAIRRARVVINLHYYENAQLEMPRIQECLSLGVPVVSEAADDQGDYPELGEAVLFFAKGSIPEMIAATGSALAGAISPEAIASAVVRGRKRFAFMFDRFLVAAGFLPASHVARMDLPLAGSTAAAIVLSLPETIGRRRNYDSQRAGGCIFFDGIRRRPGWIGCALSYSALARHALREARTLTVMEDDVLLPDDFAAKIEIIREYLRAREGQWDVFSGVIACMPGDIEVSSVEIYKGMRFAFLNRMTSMVFNIYSRRALEILASWDPAFLDPDANTIDSFLGGQPGLRVVVTWPFLVGHREDASSTLWGFRNTQYAEMIRKAESRLSEKMQAHAVERYVPV